MRIATILGSPRIKGNTALILERFEEQIRGFGHEIHRINITGKKVQGCLGCHKCEKVITTCGCVQKDDAQEIFDALISCDAIVYATPLYTWSVSAQLKALMDRHLCLVKNYMTPQHASLLEGKNASLLVTCAGPIEDNADIVQVFFKRFCHFLRINSCGEYVVPFCKNIPEEPGAAGINIADKMAADMTKTIL